MKEIPKRISRFSISKISCGKSGLRGRALGQRTKLGPRAFGLLLVVGGLVMLGVVTVGAQEKKQPASLKQSTPSAADAPLDFEQETESLRSALKRLVRSGARFHTGSADESEHWRTEWRQARTDVATAADRLQRAAVERLFASDSPPTDIMKISFRYVSSLLKQGRMGEAYRIAHRMALLDPENLALKRILARAAMLTNHFSETKKLTKEHVGLLTGIPDNELHVARNLDKLEANFLIEQAIRKKEAQANDLPRVELTTTRGKIVIELYENEAPQTVANFIALVEKGFYNDIYFHHVIRHFVAQAGLVSLRGPRKLDYTIYDECHSPQARKHFRGTVSMFRTPKTPNSGNSQFFITRIPVIGLDGEHTVFGRVIEGMDVVDTLAETFEFDKEGKETFIQGAQPDHIISAKVIRKRDHPYKTIPVKP